MRRPLPSACQSRYLAITTAIRPWLPCGPFIGLPPFPAIRITTAIRPWLPCGGHKFDLLPFAVDHYHGYQAVAPLRHPTPRASCARLNHYHGYQAVAPLRPICPPAQPGCQKNYHGYQAVAPLRQIYLALVMASHLVITTAIRPWLPCGQPIRRPDAVYLVADYHGYQAVAPLRLMPPPPPGDSCPYYHGYQAVAPLRLVDE